MHLVCCCSVATAASIARERAIHLSTLRPGPIRMRTRCCRGVRRAQAQNLTPHDGAEMRSGGAPSVENWSPKTNLDGIELQRPDGRRVGIVSIAATRSGVGARGFSIIAGILDEWCLRKKHIAGRRASLDRDVYAGLMGRLPEGKIIAISTPLARDVPDGRALRGELCAGRDRARRTRSDARHARQRSDPARDHRRRADARPWRSRARV